MNSDLVQLGITPDEINELEGLGALDPAEAIEFIKAKLNEAKRPARLLMRAERFLQDHFQIRLNIISNQIESRQIAPYTYEYYDESGNIATAESTTTDQWAECKSESIERSLTQNHIALGSGKVKTLLRSSFVPDFNPFANYFENLPPVNQSTDVYEQLCNFLQFEDEKNFKIQFKKHLIRCVKCALEPNYFNKQMFVLMSGDQNPGKSSFIRWLCPPALKSYYAEDPPLDKDGLIALASNFIINFDELSYLYKKDENIVKGWMSKESVQVRRPYAATVENIPRRASMFGSTNEDEFLRDGTGNVRYIVFKLKKKSQLEKGQQVINWSYKTQIDIDQLWAYIYKCYLEGQECNLSATEIEENEARNRDFKVISSEAELVSKYFKPTESNNAAAEFYMASEILNMLQIQTGNRQLNHKNVGMALKELGFEKTSQYTVRGGDKKTFPGYWVIRQNGMHSNNELNARNKTPEPLPPTELPLDKPPF